MARTVAHAGRILFAVLAMVSVAVCATQEKTIESDKPIVPRLTVARVKEIAAERARANGFAVKSTAPWAISLQVNPNGLLWTAILEPLGSSRYWLNVDDETGRAEFVMPVVQSSKILSENADWLSKADQTIHETQFPVELDTLLKNAAFSGAQPTGGGATDDGLFFLEYNLRVEKDTPARFEVRFYYTTPQGPAGPKMVTAAELAYWDASLYRYRLVRDPK